MKMAESSSITLEFKKITEQLEQQVQDILHANIEEFKKTVSEEVHKSVYPFYAPKNYTRREDSGGLSDIDNYEVIENRLSLTLTNKTQSGTNYWKYRYSIPITEVVEEGSGDGWVDVPSRPFMEKALDKFAHEILEPQINALGGE
jgi:dimeric dUTPase (all-alpha-NTP-PPase superfamily)